MHSWRLDGRLNLKGRNQTSLHAQGGKLSEALLKKRLSIRLLTLSGGGTVRPGPGKIQILTSACKDEIDIHVHRFQHVNGLVEGSLELQVLEHCPCMPICVIAA